MLPYNRRLKPLSRQLRNDMTDAEQRLWACLRRKQLGGLQFYRQKPLAGYIVDFYCAAARLVIELDGSQHHASEAIEYDRQRTRELEALGLRVIRFDNRQVLRELAGVLEVIGDAVGVSIPPGPPFAKGGGRCGS
ncbi:Very-short-patch-repair endonuclease [Pseudomonas linyingensis]|uniref:Very-short-patch-repair endonuclease n=1 Tax=Pseudomonas linyingensis TaxID=915471 RepID=A0A1H7CKX6_9PSED|nr:endonuclease domain-containing protein [Pseudomonas linyingensis]SEJ86365.1 Very-short-patch-repair endonuclease [Pseudomonas linyingensis]